MKNLKDFENDLNKCSKCGLCESVCPLFKLVPNDCVASKGKFIMLHGVTKGDLKLSKKINKYIDMCLKCGKCVAYCPSDIDVCRILGAAKYEYVKGKLTSKIVKLFQSKPIFRTIIKFGQLLNSFADKPAHQRFDCCGLPFLTEGNMERFEQAAIHNIKNFSSEADCIVTDCASCENTLLSYPKYVDDGSKIRVKTFVNWGDLIAEQDLKFKSKKPVAVTFHKPCHLKSDEFFDIIMSRCANVNYIKMEKYDDCCGFAGSFAFKNPKLSVALMKEKAKHIKMTSADYVITTCPSCVAGLKQGLMMVGAKTKVVTLLEFLATKCSVIED